MPIKIWEKIGEAATIAGEYGKKLVLQMFMNPDTNLPERFVLFGQKDWSVVLALTPECDVLVVRQFKQGCNKILDELPAGTADFKGEIPEDVMKRELLQETGYTPSKVTGLGSYWMSSRGSWTRYHCFLATDCIKEAEPKTDDLSEQIESRLMPLAEWLNCVMTKQEEYVDEPSAVVATFRSLPHLGIKLLFP